MADAINAVGMLVALAQGGRQCCLDAKQYKVEASRIGLRLTWIVAKTKQWQEQLEATTEGGRGLPQDHPYYSSSSSSSDIYERFKEALIQVNICLQAASMDKKSMKRHFVVRRLKGKNLLLAMLDAEQQLNILLQELHLEQNAIIFKRMEENFMDVRKSLQEFEARRSRPHPHPHPRKMQGSSSISISSSFGNSIGTTTERTIEEEVDEALERCHAQSREIALASSSQSSSEEEIMDPTEETSGSFSYDGRDIDEIIDVTWTGIRKRKVKTSRRTTTRMFEPSEAELNALTIDVKKLKFPSSSKSSVPLGSGAFSDVYAGTYKAEAVAIKVLKLDTSSTVTENAIQRECQRIATEALLMQNCAAHPNIVEVYGCITALTATIPRPLIVMELLSTTLFDVIHRRHDDIHRRQTTSTITTNKNNVSIPPYWKRLHLLAGIANAVEFLHLQGIVHHDIKTHNILLNATLSQAKLSDFGEAKVKGLITTKFRSGTTTTRSSSSGGGGGGLFTGTVAYMAPEVLSEEVLESSRASDMYSLGVVVWECLTGRIPHQGRKEHSIIVQALNKKQLPMLPAPTRKHLASSLSPINKEAWKMMEVVSNKCTSRDRAIRLNASQVVKEWRSFHLSHADHHLAGAPNIKVVAGNFQEDINVVELGFVNALDEQKDSDIMTRMFGSSSRKIVVFLSIGVLLLVAGTIVVGIVMTGGREDTQAIDASSKKLTDPPQNPSISPTTSKEIVTPIATTNPNNYSHPSLPPTVTTESFSDLTSSTITTTPAAAPSRDPSTFPTAIPILFSPTDTLSSLSPSDVPLLVEFRWSIGGSMNELNNEFYSSPSYTMTFQVGSPQYMALDWIANIDEYLYVDTTTILERYILAVLYYSTKGESWAKDEPWESHQFLTASHVCDWLVGSCSSFVECNADQRITSLDIRSLSFEGTIPAELGYLSSLTTLTLGSHNALIGSIPTQLGMLTSLTYLDLTDNALTGPVPTEIGFMTSLEHLNLSYNSLTGSIPTEFGGMTHLREGYFSFNGLEGSFPTEIGKLTNAEWLNFASNNLIGTIPIQFGQLTNLEGLRLFGNHGLTGDINAIFCDSNANGEYLKSNFPGLGDVWIPPTTVTCDCCYVY